MAPDTTRGWRACEPIPPGLRRLPSPGHTVVSLALRRLLLAQPQRETGLGVIDAGPIAESGVTRPDELASNTQVQGSAVAAVTPVDAVMPAAGPSRVVVGFGSRESTGSSLPLGLEALLQVAVPALVLLGGGFLFVVVVKTLVATLTDSVLLPAGHVPSRRACPTPQQR